MIRIPGGVLCCGNLVQDILVRPVERLVFDTSVWVDAIELSIGGNGANTSYAAGLLGVPVRLLGYAGADDFGASILGKLETAKADTSQVVRLAEARTATSVAVVNSAGARAILHEPGASAVAFSNGVDLTASMTAGCSHFHLANPFALPLMRRHAGDTLRAARAAGLTTSMDTGWDSRGEWMAVAGPCLAELDLLFVNEAESRILSGAADTDGAARFFQERGVRAVVVKLGRQGCCVYEGDAAAYVPAFEVEAVDSTGAGDCFVGAFLAGLHEGMDALAAARLANAAGALSVSRMGSVAGLLPLEDTLRWMKERK